MNIQQQTNKTSFIEWPGFRMALPVLVFAICSCVLPLYAQNVEEIIIEGNESVSDKMILESIHTKKGAPYDAKLLGQDISVIYELDKFDDVAVYTEEISEKGLRVIFKVEEKRKIGAIDFKGNDNIKSKKLLKKIDSKRGELFDDFTVSEDREKITEYYGKKGYAKCTVDRYVNEDPANNTVDITFHINEGNKVELKSLTISGVRQEKYKKVIKQLESKEGKNFREDVLAEDIGKLTTFYKNRGYLNVDVSKPVINYNEQGTESFVLIDISEGEKFFIGELSFSGNSAIESGDLHSGLKQVSGEIYSEEKVGNDIMRIQELYGNKGYIKMSVTPYYSYNKSEKRVNIDYELFEGPRVFIRNIYLDGNYVTRDYVIKREFKVREGDPFNLEKIRKTQAEIFRLGFFQDIKLEMLPADSPDKTDIVIIVEEQKTGMASIGAGYSSEDKLVGTLRVTQSNLMGRGQSLSAMWEFGKNKQNYRIDFTEPYFFNTPTPFSVSVYNTLRRRYLKDHGYDELRRGGSFSFGRHFSDYLSVSARYSLEEIKIDDVSLSIKDDLDESSDTTSSVTPSISYDTRDYPFNPRKGYILRASNQIAGGMFSGDRDFLKFESQATYFQPIIWRVTGVANAMWGSLTAYGDSPEVPIYEKFLVGGAESVRGYEYWGDIGPDEGGNYKLVTNFEIKFPIVMERGMTVLQGAFFYDIGSTWNRMSDISLTPGPGEDDLKRGMGFGIRFKTRAFPIRMDWGYGFDKPQPGFQWYFTLGDIF
jgi:outer membrane protein insertion porin family